MAKRNKLFFIIILLISILLRFYQLGVNPSSLDWDEASLGYNAYHLLKTGSDEYGERWPLAIRSFGDYKPSVYVYLTIPPVAIFGLTEVAVRLPSAILGVLTVVVTFFLVKELFRREDLALLSMFFLAISPWHLQFSRIAFEANVGLFWFVAGVWLFLKGIKNGIFLAVSAVSFALSLYSYHSPRLVLPFLLIGYLWYFRQALWQHRKYVFLAFLTGLLFVLPLVKVFLTGAGLARFSSVSIFSSAGILDRSIPKIEQDQRQNFPLGFIIHNRRLVWIVAVLKGYLDHWNFDFLFLKGDAPGRHHAVGMGMLYLWDFPFLLAGIYWLLKEKGKNAFPLFWWFLVAPLASAIATGTPHAERAPLYLPVLQIFVAYGVLKLTKKIFFFGAAFLLLINGFYCLHQYYVHSPIDYAFDWQYGYKQMVEVVNQEEENFDKIVVTKFYDQPYIFFLFYNNRLDPNQYKNDGTYYLGFGKYEFRKIDWSRDQKLEKTLIVGTGEEIPEGAGPLKAQINFPNGEVAFRIVGK